MPGPYSLLVAALPGLAAILLAVPASAQVNTDPLRPGPVRPGLGGGFDASFMQLGGNVEIVDVGFGGRIQTQTFWAARKEDAPETPPFMKQFVLLMGNFHYTARAGQPFLNQGLLHGRWLGGWHRRVGSTVFVQHQFNEFQRLRVRSVWGTSLALQIVHLPKFSVSGGSGYMFEYNRIAVSPGAPDAPQTFEHRWSNFLGVRLHLFDGRLSLQSSTYVQPRFDRFSDFRLLEEVEALAKVSEMFGFGASFSVLHDSAPPTGVKPTDTRVATNLRVSF
jgi:hypothetical protein